MTDAVPAAVVESLAEAVAAYHRDPRSGGYAALKDRITREAKRHRVSFAALFAEAHRVYSAGPVSPRP